ncbi:MAG TPA: methyltransferase type 11, partial [Rhizobiales bacterium]|nr:methyltransferase type 11 [Hyphomicrobiales bacterium]
MNLEVVKNYYGKVLKSSEDLKTSACCDGGSVPAHLEPLLANVHEEVRAKYYGCGIVVPAALEGRRVLDLGSGSGRDVYLVAQLVGPVGEVVGVDMTDEQLATAETHIDWHMRQFGHERRNVRFLKGYIEKLDELGLEPASFDVVVSNCVINLSIDKPAVLRGAFDLLKPGGELHFADVYCDRRLSDSVRADPVLYGECLGGALYWNDFLPLAKRAGFLDPRLVTSRPLDIKNEAIKRKLGQAQFFSATYRLFKLDGLETACEDYGQAVVYRGSVAEEPDAFALDGHHLIERGKVFPVCGNTWRVLADTRFAPHFDFIGDFGTHYGIFPGCGTSIPFATTAAASPSKSSSGC